MRVVLIDDDEDLSFATGVALKAGGFVPVAFPDCDAAAAELGRASWRPRAILMDVHLGAGMSPEAFIGWLREHGLGDVPVLLVSASHDVAEVARTIGATGYLRKPFDISELVSRVAGL